MVEAAINAALNAYTATNATTDADIATIVNDANTNSGVSGVIVSWGTPVFKNINSTNAADGKVTGTLDLTCTSGSTAAAGKLSFDLPIKRSDAQKLADAKTKAETALAAMTATNATIADDVLTAVNNALSGTGAVATWKTNPSDFNKTLATDNVAGSITGSIVVTFNGSTSDVAVKLTITKLIADKTVLNNTITDANNAKNGISINNSPDTSSVLSGTMYVSDAEMKALTDAITAAQAVLDKTNPSATDAELTAAATALNNAVNTFKAVIKTGIATSLGSNGSGAGGGPSSGNGNTTSSSTVGTQKPTNSATPTTVQTNVSATVDKNGNASATVSNKTMQDAINKAKTDAQKNGTSKNDVSVTINVNTGGNGTNAVKVNLPKTVQDTLVRERVAEFEIQSETANLSFDNKTLQSIQKQAGGDVTVNASKTDVSKLSKEVRDEIGNRPVYDLSITGPNGKIISDFDGGSVTVSIPYKLQPGENPNNVQAYFIDAKGEAFEVTCTYDSATQSLVFVTNHFSIYAIGYNENAPKFNDVANHWAKNDIEFVTARGLLAGTGNNVFAPDTAITNGNFAKALTKLAGKDMSGLVKGDKNKAMTRQEMAEIMVQFAKTTGYTLTQNRAEIKFTDTKNEAVKTMQMAGVIMAKNGSKFDP
ncbi:MAG: S-layer homology domain-containing protein, partial [Oscillospiraceae bacterium]